MGVLERSRAGVEKVADSMEADEPSQKDCRSTSGI